MAMFPKYSKTNSTPHKTKQQRKQKIHAAKKAENTFSKDSRKYVPPKVLQNNLCNSTLLSTTNISYGTVKLVQWRGVYKWCYFHYEKCDKVSVQGWAALGSTRLCQNYQENLQNSTSPCLRSIRMIPMQMN